MAPQDAGNFLSFAQLEGLWVKAGGPASLAPLMAAVALAESSGNPDATNPTDNNGTQTSWGLWQISLGNHNEPAPNWNDPLENAKLAVGKWKNQGLRAWGTYDSGIYKRYLPKGYVPPNYTFTRTTGGTLPPPGKSESLPQEVLQGIGAGFSWVSPLGGAYSDITSGLLTIPKEVIGFFGDIDTVVVKAFEGLKLFFQPSTYVRIGAGFFGFVFVIVGLVFLAREARESAT